MTSRSFATLTALWLTAAAACNSDEPPLPCQAGLAPARPDGLIIAGSGTALAPIRAAIELYRNRHPDTTIHLAQSIGSKGAVRALADGAIDLGLASRPLTPDERALGIVEHPLARVALAPVVHRSDSPTPDANQPLGAGTDPEAIGAVELAAIYRGEVTAWPDGTLVVPLVRQPDDSATRAVAVALPALAAAMQSAGEGGRALIRYTDQDLRDTLLAVPGAIGFLDTGTVVLEALPLVVLHLDSAQPSAADPDYPLTVTLSVLSRATPTAREAELVDFLASPEVADRLASAGYAVNQSPVPVVAPTPEPP